MTTPQRLSVLGVVSMLGLCAVALVEGQYFCAGLFGFMSVGFGFVYFDERFPT